MAGQRARRAGQSLLPIRRSRRRFSHTVSCWYCDFKVTALNETLFAWGRKHARFLRVWFSIGVGFSFMALFAVICILIGELVCALHVCHSSSIFWNLSSGVVFGLSPSVPGLNFSIMDTGYLIFSTLASVFIHECGHAVAAARSSW